MTDRLYLPISTEKVDALLSEQIVNGDTLATLSLHEAAALVVINQLPQLNGIHLPKLEKVLHGIIDTGLKFAEQSDTPFIDEIRSKFSESHVRQGLMLAKDKNIYLMPESDVEKAEFLDGDGRWDYEFKAEYQHPSVQETVTVTMPNGQLRDLFSSQFRLFHMLESAMSDEHHQIEGYAGTGKTHMLSGISEILVSRQRPGKNILALAHSIPQLQGLRKAIHFRVETMTFGQLASFIIPPNDNDPNITRLKQYTSDYSPNPIRGLAEELQLKQIKEFTPNRVSSALFQMVAQYCWSRDESVGARHIPKWMGRLSEEDTAYMTSHADLLWELGINPPANFPLQLPKRDYHAIKYASLKGYKIPYSISHLLLDESHDLSEAMLDIISRSPQGYTGLGDPFQAVRGFVAQRSTPVIERQIATSIRTPGKFGALVNFSLDLHPRMAKQEFVPNRERTSRIEYYDRPDVPDEPTAIWVEDMWELFEWAERLSAVNLPYRILGSSDQLRSFAKGCITLYRKKQPAKIVELGRYRNWDAVMAINPRHRSIKHLTRLFERGYKEENWQKTEKLQSKSAEYVIGLFQHSRNHEFNRVMLAPAIIQQLYDVKKSIDSDHPDDKAARATLASRLYLGITRSKHTLILPKSFEEFMHFL